MTKLFKKFFIATLSFVMMIACAFTFTTYKASASTNDDVQTQELNAENIANYASDLVTRLPFDSTGTFYLIVDSQIFIDGSGDTLSDLSTTTFFTAMADAIVGTDPDSSNQNTSTILQNTNMVIILHDAFANGNSSTYKNLSTGSSKTTASYSTFLNWLGNPTNLYAAVVWEMPNRLYNMLYNIQGQTSPNLSIYAFPRDEIIYSNTGLSVFPWNGEGFEE